MDNTPMFDDGGGNLDLTMANVMVSTPRIIEDTTTMVSLSRLLEDTTPTDSSSSSDVSGPLNTLAEIASNLLLFLLIFGMSATVDMKNLVKQLHNKFAILTGCAMQFLIMPLLGYLTILALENYGFSSNMGLTLLIVTASPGGSYSNWWCSLFNADLALSVTMTAISTVLSVALLPANLMLYTHAAYGFSREDEESILSSVDFKTLFISLAIVIAAIFSGLYASYRVHSPTFQVWSNRLGSISGILLVVFSAVVSSVGGGEGSAKLWDQHWSFYVGVAAPCLVGLLLSNIFARLARLKKPEVVTVSVECCYQNVGIASTAALAMFNDEAARSEALLVPLFYGVVEAIVLGLYCATAWKVGWTKAPKDEQLCVVISKTYEIIEDETQDSSPSEGIEVEYRDAEDGTAVRVLGPTSQTSVQQRSPSTSQLPQDLEAGDRSPASARSRLGTTDSFPENASPNFHTGLLDRIVTFFNRGPRRRSQVSLTQEVAEVHDDTGDLKKETNGGAESPLVSRERAATESTVVTDQSFDTTFTLDESSRTTSSASPEGRGLGGDATSTAGASADLILPSLDEENGC